MIEQWRRAIWKQLNTSETYRRGVFISPSNIVIIVAIFIMLLTMVLRSMETMPALFDRLLLWVQFGLWLFFVVEWFLRLWVCVEDPVIKDAKYPRFRWFLRPTSWLDFIAIMPLIALFLEIDNRFIFELRLIRLFLLIRLFRFVRKSKAVYYLTELFRRQWKELFLSVSLIMILTYVLATLLWIVEKEVNDGLSSIPKAFWWAAVSITSVGYGDVVPITTLGKMVASTFLLLSMAFIVLPGAIMAAGFMELLREENIQRAKREHGNLHQKNK